MAGRDRRGIPGRTRLASDLPLLTPDGAPRALGEVATGRLLVIQLVRYFGCLPCQEWLIGLDGATDALGSSGASAVAIGGSADYQARWLRDTRGVRMPLLLDPEHRVRDATGTGGALGLRLAHPRGLLAYAAALGRGMPVQRLTRDTVRSPGVVILDASLTVRWVHRGRRIGDYPPLDAVLSAVATLS